MRLGRLFLLRNPAALEFGAGGTPCLNIAYLESLPDLKLRIEATDALCEHDMRTLMQGLHSPLGRCMLLSMVLADGLFSGLSANNFNAPFKPKLGAFEVLYSQFRASQLKTNL